MKSIFRLMRFIKPYRYLAVLSMLLLAGVVLADLIIPRLTQDVIDNGIAQQDMGAILNSSFLMLGAAVASALLAVANTITSVRVAQGVAADLRSALVRKVQTFSFGNLDRVHTGQLLVRSTSDVNQMQMIFLMSLRMLTRAPLWMLGSMVMLIATDARLGWLIVGMLPFIGALSWFFLSKGQPLFMSVQKRLDRLNRVMQENLAGVRVVKAFVREDHEKKRFGRANLDLTASTLRVMQIIAVLIPTMMLLVNLAVVGVVWFGGSRAIQADFSVGKVVASINYISYSLFPMMMLAGMIGPISAADASASRILEVLDSEIAVQENAETKTIEKVRGRVTFENVTFSYNGASEDAVLKHVSLVAEPGQNVALLGATGSGKSSLVHLIPRFYDVEAGRVTLDGVDVRNLPLAFLRSQIGMAMQETVLFSGTVRDNIRYGKPVATEDEVIEVAKAAQAHEFILTLPQGYDTHIGQRGVNLSGGQKQRIAIARALLVKPPVLILDDSTSAVDVETEAEIQMALGQLRQGRTSFIIAQRISTVLHADKIVVLDRGCVAAEGTHAELIATSLIYQEIYESQLGASPDDLEMDREVRHG